MNYKQLSALAAAMALGALIAYIGMSFLGNSESTAMQKEAAPEEPIYWVAPMDANYQRDKPGKSPMGMDLIPVYADGGAGSDSGPGTIKISPEVVNNLGVRTVTAEHRTINSKISTVGYIQFNEDTLIHIHPRVEGWIEKLYVKAEGDPIKKNQALYEIYSPALVNAQEEMLLALNRNNKVLIKAAEDRLRALQLPETAIKKLKQTKKVAQFVTFYAPQKGVVGELNIREGFFVKPGTSLLSIAKLDEVWVEVEVFARQASLVEVGIPVTMSLEYLPGRTWQGKIDYIYPILNPMTRTLKVRLRFNNEDRVLKPNMFAQVLIQTKSNELLLTVPREAIIRTGESNRVVLALGGGRFKSVNVQTGLYDEKLAVILEGLDSGDEVVSSAQFLLDSESSKTSDFQRMSSMAENMESSTVWVKVTINKVMVDHQMVNVSHEAIDEWDWPSMTMDFTSADWVDLNEFIMGEDLQIEIEKDSKGSTIIIDYRSAKMNNKVANSASVKGVVNVVDTDQNILNISRDEIVKWNRGPATLDFKVQEGIDLTMLSSGTEINFTFYFDDGNFVITDIRNLNKPAQHPAK